jgi:hypothetical protein
VVGFEVHVKISCNPFLQVDHRLLACDVVQVVYTFGRNILSPSHFIPEDGGDTLFRKVDKQLQDSRRHKPEGHNGHPPPLQTEIWEFICILFLSAHCIIACPRPRPKITKTSSPLFFLLCPGNAYRLACYKTESSHSFRGFPKLLCRSGWCYNIFLWSYFAFPVFTEEMLRLETLRAKVYFGAARNAGILSPSGGRLPRVLIVLISS